MRHLIYGLLLFTFQGLSAQNITDTLKVGYASAPPFIIVEQQELTGINVWLWEKVAEDLNITYEYVPLGFSAMLEIGRAHV